MVKRFDDTTPRIDGNSGRMTDDRVMLPELNAVFRYVNVAIGDGLDFETARSCLDRMGLGVGAYSPVSHKIDGHETVAATETRELQLTHADRFERDIWNVVRQRG